MKTRVISLTALACFLFAFAAAAQENKTAKEADIRRLLEAMGTRKMMESIMPQMGAQMRQAMEKYAPSGEAGERAKEVSEFIWKRMQEEMGKMDVEKQMIPIYDKFFTQEEIKGLVQFYESPLGKRLIELLPQITQESMASSMQWSQEIMQRIMKEMKEKFPELKDLPIPPAH